MFESAICKINAVCTVQHSKICKEECGGYFILYLVPKTSTAWGTLCFTDYSIPTCQYKAEWRAEQLLNSHGCRRCGRPMQSSINFTKKLILTTEGSTSRCILVWTFNKPLGQGCREQSSLLQLPECSRSHPPRPRQAGLRAASATC